MGQPLEFDVQAHTGVIRLNRPTVHNTVDGEVIDALERILRSLRHRPELRFLILTGAGGETFCAGGDLNYFATLKTRARGMRMSRRMCAILDRLAAGPQVVIAAVNGRALGGGCEILTACHFRIAASTASFAFRQAANGLTTGWGGGIRLFQLVARTQALRLLVTAETLTAEEALRIGLVDRVVPPHQLLSAAEELVRAIDVNSPASVKAFLELATLANSGKNGRARELQLFGERWMSEDFGGTLSKFLGRRIRKH